MVPTCSRNFPVTVVWLSICTIRAREAWQRVACIPSRGGKGREAIPLVASSRGNREKLKISGQIGTSIKRFSHSLYAWLTLYWNCKWNWGTIHSRKWTIKESVLTAIHTIIPKADRSVHNCVNLYPVCQNDAANNSSSHNICWTVDTKVKPTKHHRHWP